MTASFSIDIAKFSIIAHEMFIDYCKEADNLTHDGKPIPQWEDLGEKVQSCWIAAAKRAYFIFIERMQNPL